MAGGTGGAGGGTHGISGQSGQTEIQGTNTSVPGGLGGNNHTLIIDGASVYGPFGAGGDGGGVSSYIDYYTEYFVNGSLVNTVPDFAATATPPGSGSPGAAIFVWGSGNSGLATFQQVYNPPPITLTATSDGVATGGGGPTGAPGYMYNVNNSSPVYVSYGPVSPHYEAGGSFSWSRSLAFTGVGTNVTSTDLDNWGFDPADVVQVSSLSLVNFSAAVDSGFSVGYAFVDHGASNLSQAYGYNQIANLADSIPDRHFRSSNSDPYSYNDNGGQSPYGLGPWNLPVPGPNQLLYIWTTDGSGSNARTINMAYTIYINESFPI